MATETLKPTMKLKWSKDERQNQLASFGTLAKVIGKGGKITLRSSSNLLNANKRVALTLIKANGNWFDVIASKTVSQMLREKQVSLSELASFELIQGTTSGDNPEPIAIVSMPTGTSASVEVTEEMVNAKTSVIDIDDLIAL